MGSGKYYLVLHVKENGKAEVIGPVQASGKVINVEFTSFSPISLIPVGDVVDPNPGDSHWGETDSQTLAIWGRSRITALRHSRHPMNI